MMKKPFVSADHVVDIGPGAGVHGGKIVAQGTPKDIMQNPNSLNRAIFIRSRSNCHSQKTRTIMIKNVYYNSWRQR